jgi:hypothetical protein
MPKIPEYHSIEGQALSLITSVGNFTGLTKIADIAGHAWAINNVRAIYVKHATSNRSPWVFNFASDHQSAVRSLFNKYGDDKTFIVMVCGREGICALTYGNYSATLEEDFTAQKYLKISKPSGGGFRVEGTNKRLQGVIPLNRFPSVIFT